MSDKEVLEKYIEKFEKIENRKIVSVRIREEKSDRHVMQI